MLRAWTRMPRSNRVPRAWWAIDPGRSEERRVGKEWRSLCDWSSDVCSSDLRALIALAPGDVPRLAEAGIDARVLMFTLVASFVACLGFGLAPAVHATRVDTNAALKQSAARLVGDRSWKIGRASCRERVEITV